MKIGTYYYPEQWPRGQWRRDFDNIVAMGMQIVHMAEFAWFEMEPSPGDIHLDWLEECVEMAGERKLSVILCTPTAAPPIWLSHQFPETLPMDETGTRGRFGGRRHYSPTSSALHTATRRIVTALANRFGDNPSVIGWQIDNEYSAGFDQSPETHAAFRTWLSRKYGSIDALNQAWGNQFWTAYYTDFSQILMPPSREPRYGNPHHHLDASRFWSWAWAYFNRIQTDILKPKIGDRFLTTNFMPFHADADPGDMARDLTLTSWDSYPVSGWDPKPVDQTFRMADPLGMGLTHDQMAGYQRRWALMELQPGTINWSGVPVRVYPGAIRLWIWTAFAHGAEFVTTYRFRQPRFGIELFHHGLMKHDGVTRTPGGNEFAQCVEEMGRLDLQRVPALAQENDAADSVGLVLDFDQMWYFRTLPQAKRWDYVGWLRSWYAAIMRLGLKVRVLRPGAPWPDGLRLVIAPALQMVDEPLLRQLDEYAGGGGHLVLTCRSGLMDRTGQVWEGPTAQPILKFINASVDAYDGLPENMFGQVEMEGRKYPWGAWGEQLTPGDGATVLATYADQFYAGAAAATQTQYKNGVVTYCGVIGDDAFVADMLARIVGTTSLAGAARDLPQRVQVLRRGPYSVALNFQDAAWTAPAPVNARFLVGERNIPPAGVAVWEEPG